MTEFTINLTHPRSTLHSLREGASDLAPFGKEQVWEVVRQIEAQIQPPVPAEPTEWGSVVRAFVCGSDRELWVRTASRPCSGWLNVHGSTVDWHRLCEPEVLRVGVGPSSEAAEPTVPLEKVRQVLRSSPAAHHLVDTSTWTAYTDLRKRVAALLPEGAQ